MQHVQLYMHKVYISYHNLDSHSITFQQTPNCFNAQNCTRQSIHREKTVKKSCNSQISKDGRTSSNDERGTSVKLAARGTSFLSDESGG